MTCCCCHFSSGSHRTHNDGHQAGTLNSLCYGQAVPAGSPGIIFITTPTPATSTPIVLQNCTRHYFHPPPSLSLSLSGPGPVAVIIITQVGPATRAGVPVGRWWILPSWPRRKLLRRDVSTFQVPGSIENDDDDDVINWCNWLEKA